MPGVPSVYYGSEWGMEGDKRNGDPTRAGGGEARRKRPDRGAGPRPHGQQGAVLGQLPQCAGPAQAADFERYADGERVLVAINADANPFDAHFDAAAAAVDLITGTTTTLAAAAH